jgi:hypothetical protein
MNRITLSQKGTIMPKAHTDSSIVEHHEDGSWTETTTITHYPATRNEKLAAWGALGALCVAPLFPLIAIHGLEKWEERKQARQAKKAAKNEND